MTELNDDFKEKPKRRIRTSSLDFIVPLQLEECIYRIQHLPPSSSLELTASHTTHPAWYSNNLNTGKFKAIFLTEGKVTARAGGKLQRWEGTSTRFEGDVEYALAANDLKDYLKFLSKAILTFYAIGIGTMIVFTLLSLNPYISVPLGGILVIIVIRQRGLKIQRTESEQLTNQIKNSIIQMLDS